MRVPAPAPILAAAALVAAATTGCSGGDPGAAPRSSPPSAASPSPSPSPSPTGPPEVEGEREVVVERVDAAPLLGFPPAEVDEDAARDFAAATAELLDAHLNDLQTGKGGALQATAPAGLAEALDAGIPGVSDLATPDRPVERARYLLRVHLDDRVRALAAVVTVVDSTGAERTAELGFVPDGDGAPALAMVPAPPPPPA